MENPYTRATAYFSPRMGIEQKISIFPASIRQSGSWPQDRIKTNTFYYFLPEELYTCPPLPEQTNPAHRPFFRARGRHIFAGRPYPKQNAALGILAKGIHDVCKRVRGIPAVVVRKGNQFPLSHCQKRITGSGYAARRQHYSRKRQA